MYTWERPRGKWVTLQSGLEFKGKRGRYRSLGGVEIIFRKEKWALTRIDRRCDSLWQSLSVTSSLFFRDKSQSSLADKTTREEIYDNWVVSEDLSSLGRKKFRELFLHLLFFKRLQHEIINIPKHHVLGWHVLNFCSHILGVTYSVTPQLPL